MREPLVSIIIPCYNVENSLGRALDSIMFQTYKNWECIIINDGSTDGTEHIAKKYSDIRFKYISFSKNRGRPVARQRGLEEAKGEYLAMIDADDWMYNDKLTKQVQWLESNPEIVLISNSMAIVDQGDLIVGKRHFEDKVYQNTTLELSTVPHPPTVIRMEEAKKHAYDPVLKNSQDADFLFKCIEGKKYFLSSEILYVYCEYNSVNKKKIIASYIYTILFLKKYLIKYPITSLKLISITLVKLLIMSILYLFNSDINRILSRRSIFPNEEEIKKYKIQKKILEESSKKS